MESRSSTVGVGTFRKNRFKENGKMLRWFFLGFEQKKDEEARVTVLASGGLLLWRVISRSRDQFDYSNFARNKICCFTVLLIIIMTPKRSNKIRRRKAKT